MLSPFHIFKLQSDDSRRWLEGAVSVEGLTNKEIAARLNLSEYTVRNHIHRILKQVDAESRSEAVDVIRASGFVLNA